VAALVRVRGAMRAAAASGLTCSPRRGASLLHHSRCQQGYASQASSTWQDCSARSASLHAAVPRVSDASHARWHWPRSSVALDALVALLAADGGRGRATAAEQQQRVRSHPREPGWHGPWRQSSIQASCASSRARCASRSGQAEPCSRAAPRQGSEHNAAAALLSSRRAAISTGRPVSRRAGGACPVLTARGGRGTGAPAGRPWPSAADDVQIPSAVHSTGP
jgi:hypothetical protein